MKAEEISIKLEKLYLVQLKEKILKWLSANVPTSRIRHILRVEKMADELANYHNLNQEKAKLAGLMHDLAKYFPPESLLQISQSEGLEIDSILTVCPHLLHANVSAIVAKKEFGIEDTEILAAIANHTLGSPAMNQLSSIVFLADTLEPGRGKTHELEHLRQIAQKNLDQAVWLTCDYTIKHLLNLNSLIHPRILLTRNWFMEKAKTHLNQQEIKQSRN
ncbi:bis(5'-nucleosyl)-tetraphosphatase (symmetrical) YqeK [Okeania sp.]|uniref:bis(5'-nucleosyl)-tetraphosphatase (symmetrical) YqeK n=1 Tax=Okeania sp. TaxID=3100323 RepID=UPI002B4B0576|nr:bis(5'-nucleosyl)-tetraphosphatase (symmetrical) YqeK [Okeania sp.]MEB3342062.1 bis(5'-nucleosyl)-tetraphosphatase (symmetrical) YqeK [Okeania sp.]